MCEKRAKIRDYDTAYITSVVADELRRIVDDIIIDDGFTNLIDIEFILNQAIMDVMLIRRL